MIEKLISSIKESLLFSRSSMIFKQTMYDKNIVVKIGFITTIVC